MNLKRMRFSQWLAAFVAATGMVFPHSVLAENTVLEAETQPLERGDVHGPGIHDVQLGEGGTIVGEVVGRDGLPRVGLPVGVVYQGRKVAEAVTDSAGRFTVTGLRGGLYQFVAGSGIGTFRLWTPGAAPPAANGSVLLVDSDRVVRAQCGATGPCGSCNQCCPPGYARRGLKHFLTNPWVIAGLIGAAIAVPIALHDDDQSAS